MNIKQTIAELHSALKGTLPTIDDAIADARTKAATEPLWNRVVLAYERQAEHIRKLLAEVESSSNSPKP